MARWAAATWKGPTPNQGPAMTAQRGLVVHIAEGTYEGTIAWQKNPTADVSSHFVIGKVAGQLAQVVDTATAAWTQRDGNGQWVSVENAGYTTAPLTAYQCEQVAQLYAWGHEVHGWPLQLTTTPAKPGLGYHSMGAENGYNWGHSACPGALIKAQLPGILKRAIAIVGGNAPTPPDGGDMSGFGYDTNAQADDVWYRSGKLREEHSGQTAQLTAIQASLVAIAAKVDIDPAELALIKAAAEAGAAAALADQADEFAAAVVAALPSGGQPLTQADVEAAVRSVFADAASATG